MLHPSRSSSLNFGRSQSSDAPYAQVSANAQTVFENGQYQDRLTAKQESSLPPTKNGQQELAGVRAQLLAIQRRTLEHVGSSLGWNVGWAAVIPTLDITEEFKNVDLGEKDDSDEKDSSDEEEEEDEPEKDITLGLSTTGISAPILKNATSNIDEFRQSYEVCSQSFLTFMALTHNSLGFK